MRAADVTIGDLYHEDPANHYRGAYRPVRVLGRGAKPGTWLVVSCGRDGEPLPEGAEPKGPDHGPTGTERTIPARQLVSDWSTYWATHGERIEAIEASETVRRLLVDRLRSLGVEVEAASVTGSGALVVRVAPAAAARFLEVLPDTP